MKLRLFIVGSLFTIAFCFVNVAIPLARLYTAMHPHRAIPQSTPADFGLRYEEIEFFSADGLRLAGWYIPSQNKAVIIMTNGHSGNRTDLLAQAVVLANKGFGVLLYDLRAQGKSEGEVSTRGVLEINDLLGAIAYVEQRPDVDPARIGAMGFSLGAQITIRVAAQSSKIRAVITDGAISASLNDELSHSWFNYPAYWVFYEALKISAGNSNLVAVTDAISQISPRPILLISAGMGDEQERNRQYFAAAHDPKTLWEIPDASHGGGFSAHPAEYSNTIVDFFTTALLN
jgi:uncharacterized protein